MFRQDVDGLINAFYELGILDPDVDRGTVRQVAAGLDEERTRALEECIELELVMAIDSDTFDEVIGDGDPPLLVRTTRNVYLSEAGQRFLEDCRRILADLQEAEDSAVGRLIWSSAKRE